MGKQYKHWCDKEHQSEERHFDIGTQSHILVETLTNWTLHDLTITNGMNTFQILNQRRRMQNIVQIAEKIECIVKDANSIYAIYDIDYEERRKKWLQARGLCYQITVMLTHISEYVSIETNIQKYVNLESNIKKLGMKIKNVMIADDKRRKEKVKKY